MKSRFLLLIVCLLFQSVLQAQAIDDKEYLIITFSRERSKFPQHAVEVASPKDSVDAQEPIMVGRYYNLQLASYLDAVRISGKLHIAGIMVEGVLIKLEGDKVIWDLFSCDNLRGLSIIQPSVAINRKE